MFEENDLVLMNGSAGCTKFAHRAMDLFIDGEKRKLILYENGEQQIQTEELAFL